MTTEDKMRDIVSVVCEYYQVDIEKVFAKTRKGNVPIIKHISCYLIRNNTKIVQAEIADFLNYKTHSSIPNAIKKLAEMMDYDNKLRTQILLLEELLEKKGITNESKSKTNRKDWFTFIDLSEFTSAQKGKQSVIFVNYTVEEIKKMLGDDRDEYEIVQHTAPEKFILRKKKQIETTKHRKYVRKKGKSKNRG